MENLHFKKDNIVPIANWLWDYYNFCIYKFLISSSLFNS
nr:MAG TPA: hypothetical protein [Caudoviricetes sp.]